MKIIKIIAAILVVAFVVLQFFQPEKNQSENMHDDIFQKEQIPENIQALLKNACMDCHSNQTTYLWYHNISPVSWLINSHVVKGKGELNFSEWGTFDDYDKFGVFEDIQKEIEQKTMPIKQYTMMHKNARLSDLEMEQIIEWCKKRSSEITKELGE